MTYSNSCLKGKVENLPNLPGVYKLLDKEKNIIYIGKSIHLKKRVKTYFSKNQKWEKAKKFSPLVYDIEYVLTDTHLEARLLECELIKKIKPIFNSQFKNDRGYVYLSIRDYNIYNPISIVYKYDPSVYGPFKRRFTLIKILESLNNLYPILKVDGSYKFTYSVLPKKMNRDLFSLNKKSLEDIFSNDKEFILFLEALERRMKEASEDLRFETAMSYRDCIDGLNYLKGSLREDKKLFLKKLLVVIPISKGYKFLFISRGKILLRETFSKYNNKNIDSFINRAKNVKNIKENSFEKSSLDFRDIIYSEVRKMPQNLIRAIK